MIHDPARNAPQVSVLLSRSAIRAEALRFRTLRVGIECPVFPPCLISPTGSFVGGGSGSVRRSVARWGAEDGEELLAAVGVGDKGDGLIAEGVEEFVGGERCRSGEGLNDGKGRGAGGGDDELGDEGGGDGEDGGGGKALAERPAAMGETAGGGDEVVRGRRGGSEAVEEIVRIHELWRRGA